MSVSAECRTATGTAKAFAEAADELRREADLRNQHQGALTAPQRVLHGV